MQIRYYGFRPGVWIQASGEIGGRGFALSAVRGDGAMDVTIRTTPNLMDPIRCSFPLDVEQHEVEWMVELLVGAPLVREEAA